MQRYLRLYAYFLQFSFSRAMEFRFDFFFRVFMDIVYYVVQFVFFLIVLRQTPLFGGWNLDQILIFTAASLLVDAIDMTVFSTNMWWLPIFVNRGDLDYYLVRPVSSLFMLMLREFAANSFLNVVIAAALLGAMIWRYPVELGAGRVAMYVVMLLLGNLLFVCVQMFFLVPVFWTHSVDGFRDAFSSLRRVMDRPHGIFSGMLLRLVTTVLPLALVISYPTMMLFSGFGAGLIAYIIFVLCAAWGLLIFVWQRALRAYSSASS